MPENENGFEIIEKIPPVEAYMMLRDSAGWGNMDPESTRAGLENSLYSVCVENRGQIIAYGRIVGDGHVYFYIQDVIVLPEYRGRGLGRKIMAAIMAYLKANAKKRAFVGGFAAKGVMEFYYPYGFKERDPDAPGMFRVWE